MGFLHAAFTTLTTLFLIHALYSIYEHRALAAQPSPPTTTTLPLDITLELLTTSTLLLLALVLSAAPLRPIAWSEWAGRIERTGWDPAAETREQFLQSADAAGLRGDAGSGGASAVETKRGGTGNPWRGLEERRGYFWDVRRARAEFAAWVREGSAEKAA